MGRSLEQIQLGGLGLRRKHHEDGEHAAGRDRLAIDEAKRIGDGIPHPPDALLTAAVTEKPLLEADPIKIADHLHGAVVIHQAPHDRAGAQGQGIAQLVNPVELGGSEKGLEAIEGSADRKAEIQFAQVATLVHEQVGVLLGEQVVDRAHLAQQGEEVGVIEEEDMQPHLDVVALAIHPAAHLAAHERAGLVEVHAVARVHQIHSSRQTRQTGTHDGDAHLHTPVIDRLYGGAGRGCGASQGGNRPECRRIPDPSGVRGPAPSRPAGSQNRSDRTLADPKPTNHGQASCRHGAWHHPETAARAVPPGCGASGPPPGSLRISSIEW